MKEFYYMTTSKGRVGGSFSWHHTFADSKAEIKKRYPNWMSTKVKAIYTAEEMMSHFTKNNLPKCLED